ncbi:multicopper oxidase domain-containing protein [Salinibacterium sp. PAMC 21357]|uniref:multicopper oxidase domain-containing protein n=1 Tax=Salinibacterium sp. PAMC 21357 TaxID=1112215 RepID=UPI000317C69D
MTASAGTSTLSALPYDRGSAGGMMMGDRNSRSTDKIALATFTVAGDTVAPVAAIPKQSVQRDLRSVTVTARRELVFTMGMGMGGGMMTPTINGQAFDAGRIDTTVQFGSVEEWLLTNTSTLDHPLHLHVWPMQIVEQDGRPVETIMWQDVVNIPARSTTRVRIAFSDFSGKSVYH